MPARLRAQHRPQTLDVGVLDARARRSATVAPGIDTGGSATILNGSPPV
jgi:hypothetical protein